MLDFQSVDDGDLCQPTNRANRAEVKRIEEDRKDEVAGIPVSSTEEELAELKWKSNK